MESVTRLSIGLDTTSSKDDCAFKSLQRGLMEFILFSIVSKGSSEWLCAALIALCSCCHRVLAFVDKNEHTGENRKRSGIGFLFLMTRIYFNAVWAGRILDVEDWCGGNYELISSHPLWEGSRNCVLSSSGTLFSLHSNLWSSHLHSPSILLFSDFENFLLFRVSYQAAWLICHASLWSWSCQFHHVKRERFQSHCIAPSDLK